MKGIRSKLNTFIDIASYSAEVRNLVAILNRRIEQPESVSIHIPSHPSGFSREIHKRRLSIAEAYIRIIHALDSDKYEERLKALESLVRQSFHAKTVSMPLNTARVQVALMKEAVKNADHRRKQLELMMDFTRASYGQETVIRALLRDHSLIEVPETGKSLSEMNLGWDDHVHDNLSEGRKTPTQVMLDAFIKGISGVTLAYYDLADEGIIREAIRSGEILGIRVRIGIEFSVGVKGARRHYMYIPAGCLTAENYIDFFARHREKLSHFLQGLHRNAENRHKTIASIFSKFNETYLVNLNEGFTDIDYLTLKPLQWEDLQGIVLHGQASRMHLGELLFNKFKQILHKRVLYYRTLYEVALQKKAGEISRWEFDMVSSRYESVRKQYETLTSECLRRQYFSDKSIVDYDSAFREEQEIFPALRDCGGELIYIHPLERGLPTAAAMLIHNAAFITHIETFNMRDSVRRNPTDLRLLSSFVSLLNGGNCVEVKHFVEEWSVPGLSDGEIRDACANYGKNRLLPRCGSDSTGRDPLIPGMGFVAVETLPRRMSASFMRHHIVLPQPVANLILSRGEPVPEGSKKYGPIVSMGKSGGELKNLVGDEEEVVYLSPMRIWKHLNPGIRNFLKVIFGFIPAFLGGSWTPKGWDYGLGLTIVAIWFGITFIRNVIVDLVSASGLDPKDWAWKDVDMDNATSSLFWTGFSVPILTFVKLGFDSAFKGLQLSHIAVFEMLKYFFIAFFNGSYIMFHNTLRGFNPNVRSRNFFRTLLSWPFATLFSPVGDLLQIPSIVQSKFWSDFVAGLIEGSGKLSIRMKLRERDIGELLPVLDSQDRQERITSMLDVLYIWARSQRGESSLYNILTEKPINRKKSSAKGNGAQGQALNGAHYRRLLHDLFTEEGAIENLSKFILVNFSGKEAMLLSGVLGTHYLHFVNWLERIEKKAEGSPKAEPAV
ncbi:MAG: hypothetical protein V2A78_00440 [bacterium]